LVPKMNYLCRTVGPAAALLADLFSKQILNTAAFIHGCNTATAPLWTLKITDGGLDLQLPSLLLAPAYLSSLCLVAKDLNTLVALKTKTRQARTEEEEDNDDNLV
jgi:hypothetical protein